MTFRQLAPSAASHRVRRHAHRRHARGRRRRGGAGEDAAAAPGPAAGRLRRPRRQARTSWCCRNASWPGLPRARAPRGRGRAIRWAGAQRHAGTRGRARHRHGLRLCRALHRASTTMPRCSSTMRGCALANYRRDPSATGTRARALRPRPVAHLVPLRRPPAGPPDAAPTSSAPEPARALALAGCDVLLRLAGASRRRSRSVVAAAAAARAVRERLRASPTPMRRPGAPRPWSLGPDGAGLARVAAGVPLVDGRPAASRRLRRRPLRDRRPRLYQRLTAVTPADADTPL